VAACQERAGNIYARIDHEPIALNTRSLADAVQPVSLPVRIPQTTAAVVGVLQVAACRASPHQFRHEIERAESITGLSIDSHRYVDAADDPSGSHEHCLGRRTFVIFIAQRGRDCAACRSHHWKSGHNDGPRRGDVPGVGQQK